MSHYQGGGYQTRIRFGGPLTSAVKALLIANGVVFVVQIIFYIGWSRPVFPVPAYKGLTPFEQLFALTPALVVDNLNIWQLLTHCFLHDVENILHVAMNMFMLWMFGGDVERALGRSRFLILYFGAALAGGLCMMPWYFIAKYVPVLGASGAVFGAMAAYARLYPGRRLLVFGVVPVKARTVVLVLAGIDLLAAITGSDAGTAHLAHLGGFAVGWFFLSLQRSASEFNRAKEYKKTVRAQQQDREVRDEVDRLLAKVGREGLNSLTARESKFLKRASKRLRR